MTTETGPVATGLLKEVRIAAESTYGTAPSGGGTSQKLRRVASTVSLDKATYRSNEIQPDRQVHDLRHGMRTVKGQISGELSPLTYESVLAQVMYNTFAAGPTQATVNIQGVAAVLNTSPGNFVRASGSWITDGFKVGDIVRATGFAGGGAANNNRNYRITSFSTTSTTNDTMNVGPTPSTAYPSVGNEAVAAIASASGVTFTLTGKKCIQAAAGSAVDASFAIEHWFSDVSHSELFTGCRASRTQIQLPPTGLGRIDFDVMGQNMAIDSGTPYFSAPTAVTTSSLTASINGIMRVGGVDYAIVTGMNFTINPQYTTESVVGSNLTPYLFPGILDVSGQFTALFLDEVLPTAFLNETEIDMQVYLTLTTAVNSDFLSFYFPRIKLISANADDKPGAIVRTYGFQALNQINGGSGAKWDATTISIQDSLAT